MNRYVVYRFFYNGRGVRYAGTPHEICAASPNHAVCKFRKNVVGKDSIFFTESIVTLCVDNKVQYCKRRCVPCGDL